MFIWVLAWIKTLSSLFQLIFVISLLMLHLIFRSAISDSGIGMICNVFPKTLSWLLVALCPNITSSNELAHALIWLFEWLIAWPLNSSCWHNVLIYCLFCCTFQVAFNLPQPNCLFLNSWTVAWQFLIQIVLPLKKLMTVNHRKCPAPNYTLFTRSWSLNIAGWRNSACGVVLA